MDTWRAEILNKKSKGGNSVKVGITRNSLELFFFVSGCGFIRVVFVPTFYLQENHFLTVQGSLGIAEEGVFLSLEAPINNKPQVWEDILI